MDQQQKALKKEEIPHEDPSKLTHDAKGDRNSTQFQKNYPKNIFIPIIQFLADMGLQEHYERAVGTREEFEGKNVVSLSLIYQLLTEQWFLRTVNKGVLEANISNKILMNSKIKKKLFHLKVAKILLQITAGDAKQYKKNVSKEANAIAVDIKEDDELFQHPSAIIYLLNFLLNCLKFLFQDQPRVRENSHQSEISNSSPNRQYNSKQQFKNLTKTIISFLNRIKTNREALEYAEYTIMMKITQRSLELNKKYQLAQGTPSWQIFNHSVVSKCFHSKIEGQKITNSIFNQWILDFKHKTNRIGLQAWQHRPQKGQLKFFTPIIIISPPLE